VLASRFRRVMRAIVGDGGVMLVPFSQLERTLRKNPQRNACPEVFEQKWILLREVIYEIV
jgi:hypothetical protein